LAFYVGLNRTVVCCSSEVWRLFGFPFLAVQLKPARKNSNLFGHQNRTAVVQFTLRHFTASSVIWTTMMAASPFARDLFLEAFFERERIEGGLSFLRHR